MDGKACSDTLSTSMVTKEFPEHAVKNDTNEEEARVTNNEMEKAVAGNSGPSSFQNEEGILIRQQVCGSDETDPDHDVPYSGAGGAEGNIDLTLPVSSAGVGLFRGWESNSLDQSKAEENHRNDRFAESSASTLFESVPSYVVEHPSNSNRNNSGSQSAGKNGNSAGDGHDQSAADDDLCIEEIINEVRDSLLDFADTEDRNTEACTGNGTEIAPVVESDVDRVTGSDSEALVRNSTVASVNAAETFTRNSAESFTGNCTEAALVNGAEALTRISTDTSPVNGTEALTRNNTEASPVNGAEAVTENGEYSHYCAHVNLPGSTREQQMPQQSTEPNRIEEPSPLLLASESYGAVETNENKSDKGEEVRESSPQPNLFDELLESISQADSAMSTFYAGAVHEGSGDGDTHQPEVGSPLLDPLDMSEQSLKDHLNENEFFMDIFKDIAESQPEAKSDPLKATGGEEKLDNDVPVTVNGQTPQQGGKETPKKGKKGKKGRNREAVINDDVLKEVRKLMEAAQAKGNTSAETGEIPPPGNDAGEEEEEKGKSKTKGKDKKKQKKGKRRSSKSEGTSPTSLPEDYSITQRRILKRGTVWKKKEETSPTSTPSPEGCSISAPEEAHSKDDEGECVAVTFDLTTESSCSFRTNEQDNSSQKQDLQENVSENDGVITAVSEGDESSQHVLEKNENTVILLTDESGINTSMSESAVVDSNVEEPVCEMIHADDDVGDCVEVTHSVVLTHPTDSEEEDLARKGSTEGGEIQKELCLAEVISVDCDRKNDGKFAEVNPSIEEDLPREGSTDDGNEQKEQCVAEAISVGCDRYDEKSAEVSPRIEKDLVREDSTEGGDDLKEQCLAEVISVDCDRKDDGKSAESTPSIVLTHETQSEEDLARKSSTEGDERGEAEHNLEQSKLKEFTGTEPTSLERNEYVENVSASQIIERDKPVSEKLESHPEDNKIRSSSVEELERRTCNGAAKVFTFNTTVSVIQPLKPSLEYVSDNSSPLSSRSSSMDRETVIVNKFEIPEGSSLKEEQSSEDVNFTPLFENIEASKLDGTSKLQMKHRKRHSLPKPKPSSGRRFFGSKSFESTSTTADHHQRSQMGGEDIRNYYENAGDILYNESCSCDIAGDLKNVDDRRVSEQGLGVKVTMTCPDGENESKSTDDSDSDNAGTWHHKNIKEKIKKIIGSRLQPRNDRDFYPKDPLTRDESPFPRSSSHSASNSKSSSEGPDSKSTSTKYASAENFQDLTHEGHFPDAGKENDVEGEEEIPTTESKLSVNPKHLMSLTYLTDSEVDAPPTEFPDEDALLIDSLTKDVDSATAPLTGIVERWETLQAKAVERQRQSTQLRQLQRQVKTLRLSMEGVLGKCSAFAHPHTLDDPSQIGRKVAEAKALLDETENLRTDLSGLNVMVYRFTSEIGSTFTPLKDEMAELYRLWDETHRRVSEELSRLQSGEATWRLWEEQKAELSQALKQDSDTLKIIDAAIDNGRLTETVTASVHDVAKLLNERRLLPGGAKNKSQFSGDLSGTTERDGKSHIEIEGKEDRLSDSGTSGYESCSSDDLSERERRLAYLRRLARDLEASLVPGSKAWNEISSTLAETEKELQGLQDHCRSLILRTAEALDDPSTKQPRFTSNGKRRSWTREGKSCRSPRVERRNRSTGPRREWIWRVVRAALPFQAALLLLLCVTCLLEPNCCDSVNTLNFNFTPQLRFVHGSPPL